MTIYTTSGKQVLYHGQYYADACSDHAATLIASALNKCLAPADPEPEPMPLFTGSGVPLMHNGSQHFVRQEGDEYACKCGMRWDVTEGEEHP